MAAEVNHQNKKKKEKKHMTRAERNRKLIFMGIAVFLLAAVGIQMGRLYQKKKNYEAEIKAYQEQLAAEQERQQELIEYEVYTQSDEYVENEARTKLGQVYDNEIIFREKN